MKLRNRKSYMISLPEGIAPVKIGPRITKAIYYFLVFFIISYLLYLFIFRLLYFKEQGFIEIEKTVISSSYGGNVLKLNVIEGDIIKKNDFLVLISAAKNCSSAMKNQISKLVYDLDLNRAKLRLLNKLISDLQSNLSNFTLLRALETGQSRQFSREKLQQELLKKRAEATLLRSQLKLQEKLLTKFPMRQYGSPECYNETIKSPYNGKVNSIKRKLNEYSVRGEPLITLIAEHAKVFIEVYLPSDQLSSLHLGDIVDVTFLDGTEQQATIDSINSATYDFTDREWVQSRPLEILVRLHLKPLNKQDANIWKQYDRMEVTVRGRK